MNHNRSSRRKRSLLILGGMLSVGMATYVGGYLALSGDHVRAEVHEDLDDTTFRDFEQRWLCTFFRPAAIVESRLRRHTVYLRYRAGLSSLQCYELHSIEDGYVNERRAARGRLRLLHPPCPEKPPRLSGEFGPEWTRVEVPGNQRLEYHKELEVQMVRWGGGNTAGCGIPLEYDNLSVSEVDQDTGLRVASYPHHAYSPLGYAVEVDVRRNSDGTPASHQVRFPKTRYLDLNGDGVFDVLCNSRDRNCRVIIMFEDRMIDVGGCGKGPGMEMRTAQSTDRTRYLFDNGAWRLAEFREAPPAIERTADQPKTPRELGPEWTKVEFPNSQQFQYRKELKVPVVHSGGDVADYEVQLEHELLHLGEFDENRGFFVLWRQDNRFDVRRNRDGTAAWHQIQFPNARYLDLNGDGTFDVFIDRRREHNGQPLIQFNDRFIAIQDAGDTISEATRTAQAVDGVAYVFDGAAWRPANRNR